MRAVIQRVSDASVTVESHEGKRIVGSIDTGILVYLGVGKGDGEKDAKYLAEKVANLRIFMDSEERMNLSLLDVGGSVLAISQFTLYADARKGRRPSFSEAAGNGEALGLFDRFCAEVAAFGLRVEKGEFGAIMKVGYVNEGPITILLDSRKLF